MGKRKNMADTDSNSIKHMVHFQPAVWIKRHARTQTNVD